MIAFCGNIFQTFFFPVHLFDGFFYISLRIVEQWFIIWKVLVHMCAHLSPGKTLFAYDKTEDWKECGLPKITE